MMMQSILNYITETTHSTHIRVLEEVQSLWSGYGTILRVELKIDNERTTAIVKHVSPANKSEHPRGWNGEFSHRRKIESYRVETNWYNDFFAACDQLCRVPRCFGETQEGQEFIMVLEDLDRSGFPVRVSQPTLEEIHLCIRWLANFHARFLGQKPEGLWRTGTYWHLETRPDEVEKMDDIALQRCAGQIDRALSSCQWQTFVHGDAKIANFCFSEDRQSVAAVDFQYVGGGCGMKDLAYFISSCLEEDECDRLETVLLDYYFKELSEALTRMNREIDFAALESSWRPLYPVAWTDFYRFLQGWSPGHWKIHSYSRRLAEETVRAYGVR